MSEQLARNRTSIEREWDEALVRSPWGVPELDASWVVDHLGDVRVVDVREPVELMSELGALRGVESVPLATVGQRAAKWDRDAPLVLVCRSGARSGRAAVALERAGFTRVASMAGGMLAVREAGLRPHVPATASGPRARA